VNDPFPSRSIMPYRYKRRRGSRYGRRYRRRRPNAARATIRGTLAPRHQYLKLKYCNYFVDDGTASPNRTVSRQFVFGIQQPSRPLRDSISPFPADIVEQIANAPCLGWEKYGTIFSRYCVHGVKVKVHISQQSNATDAWHILDTVLPEGNTSTAYALNDIIARPYTRHHILNANRTLTIKRYINNNAVFGEVVKKHDRYVHDWVAGGTVDANTSAGSYVINMFDTDQVTGTSQTPQFNITLTYYISALSINADPGVSALMLKSISDPVTSETLIGDQPRPNSQAWQTAQGTGVAQTKQNLSQLSSAMQD
jgi:hypothetical protein